MRLINADELRDIYSGFSNGLYSTGHFITAIDECKTVDAAPVRHGHWWDVGSLSCRCSECGCKNDRETMFCPNCGAKMDFLYDLRSQNGFGGRAMTTDEMTAWDVFEAITSAYGGKQIFFLQKNGMVYDRYKADYITFEEAINRFCKMIGDDGI